MSLELLPLVRSGIFFASFPRQGILDYIAHRSLIQVNTVLDGMSFFLAAVMELIS